ncbi:ATP-binding protein [Nonomuraea dietziae]|uniref:ATP-binding protein n=1 Tax=Nonomuraea dietziae TaxID=65515 RepID=UPI0033DD3567
MSSFTASDLSEQDLVAQLSALSPDAEPIPTILRTDRRVLARVTDGIYRQPGSALRELISNAHDADASTVTIRTDRPRFERVIVEDDGLGMSPETLVHLLYHIGGSVKRTALGESLGVTRAGDPTRSPSGRKLIGKIGIGIFSVAQLTQSFQIITKVQGDDHRTVANIVMKQYAEESSFEADDPNGEYEAGKVLIWREPAADVDAHGTSVVLTAMRPQTRDTLRNFSLWQSIFPSDGQDNSSDVTPPRFNIGVVQPGDDELLRGNSSVLVSLPWRDEDDPGEAFACLVNAVWHSQFQGDPNPRIDKLFDYYLKMVWSLSLSAPLPYVEKHPFDITADDAITVYDLRKYPLESVQLSGEQSVREYFQLGNAVGQSTGFRIFIDGLELKRPIDVRKEPPTSGVLTRPLLFVGRHREDFAAVDRALTGGPLEFQAYICWSPKVVPAEHAGVLIRVHNATGMLFDETFLRFPVAEQRRMSQISCEIFITEGFDGALNIDRESFNYAHPHVVVLTRWLHESLRQVIATQKRLGSKARGERKQYQSDSKLQKMTDVVEREWATTGDQDANDPPEIVFVDDTSDSPPQSSSSDIAAYHLRRAAVVGEVGPGANSQARQRELEAQIASIARLLAAYGVLDSLSIAKRETLLAAIREVIQAAK